jgi:hypothetical protein
VLTVILLLNPRVRLRDGYPITGVHSDVSLYPKCDASLVSHPGSLEMLASW